ncbi:uncharacterized protein EV154DRAFT_586595 [Mucor mucedo]|uniref:uncharacterized protein n=1 Tax=Mucor mucedo TaxID=29922 RepID=UPI002220DBE5|nr:uncharacterized protein EV154DRAFT_586595 [Mucor mucedo]KAI7863618.1 hypothetical protein EV154DRAFT_586595 [Mucor mucedo]
MYENVFIEQLLREITHLAHLFFFLACFSASFVFLFLLGKCACFFGLGWASVSGVKPSVNRKADVIGELFVLRNGRITPVALAKNDSLLSTFSPVAPSSPVEASSSVVPSSAVLASPCAAPSPSDVAFSSVFVSPFGLPSVTSEGTQQSFSLRSVPVSSYAKDRQCYSIDCACVAGLPCVSGGRLPTFPPPMKKLSSAVSFGLGCEAITQALLVNGIAPAADFVANGDPSSASSLAIGQVFSSLGVAGAMSGTSGDVVSDMDIDDVAVPVSGESDDLGVCVVSSTVTLDPSVALAPAKKEVCGVSLPPCGLDLLSAAASAVVAEDGLVDGVSLPPCGLDLFSAAVSAVVAEEGLVGGDCSAIENSGVVPAPVVPVAALPRPVATPRRLRSGCRVAESSAVGAAPIARTVADVPLCPPAFSSSLCEKQQSRGKRPNDAPPPPATVRACYVPPLSVASAASFGSVSAFPVVASVPSLSSLGSVAAGSSVSVAAVSSASCFCRLVCFFCPYR